MEDVVYRLLSLCAHAEINPLLGQKIAQAAAQVTNWESLPARAEQHGLAPLLYNHLTYSGVQLPLATRRELMALSLRHRLANQVNMHWLECILSAFQETGIPALVLKGAALCSLLYPQPGLRPMSDLDLLVSRRSSSDGGPDIERALHILGGLGFGISEPDAEFNEHRHIAPATLCSEGFTISVELHHNLFEEESSQLSLEYEYLKDASIPFQLGPGGFTARTLGYEDTLHHLCGHLVENNQGFGPVRLIWAADIVSFAERFEKEIDWERMKNRYPLVKNTLSLLDVLIPLADDVRKHIPQTSSHIPRGMGEDYQGWPVVPLGSGRSRSYGRILLDTFFPVEWWLRLRYGLGRSGATLAARLHHAFNIMHLVSRRQ